MNKRRRNLYVLLGISIAAIIVGFIFLFIRSGESWLDELGISCREHTDEQDKTT